MTDQARVAVLCDGRNPGDHRELTVATWVRMPMGRSHRWLSTAGTGQQQQGHAGARPPRQVLDDGRVTDQQRCPRCGLDVQVAGGAHWDAALDALAAAGHVRVALRHLTRATSR